MENKNIGDWLVIIGIIIHISTIIGWAISLIAFRNFSILSFLGFIGIPTDIVFLIILIGSLIKVKKANEEQTNQIDYHIVSIACFIIGLYNILVPNLIDSPIGPPLLGFSDMNVGLDGIYLISSFGSLIFLILCGYQLWMTRSKKWLVACLVFLVISIGAFQYWANMLLFGYERIMYGP